MKERLKPTPLLSTPKRKRTGFFGNCATCRREFYVYPSRLKQQPNVRYCSVKCYDKHGANNPFFGRTHSKEAVEKIQVTPQSKG